MTSDDMRRHCALHCLRPFERDTRSNLVRKGIGERTVGQFVALEEPRAPGFSGAFRASEVLGLSEGTVKTHLQHLFEKTAVRRQADLIKLVAAHASPFHAGRSSA
jgi:hypothetical protein